MGICCLCIRNSLEGLRWIFNTDIIDILCNHINRHTTQHSSITPSYLLYAYIFSTTVLLPLATTDLQVQLFCAWQLVWQWCLLQLVNRQEVLINIYNDIHVILCMFRDFNQYKAKQRFLVFLPGNFRQVTTYRQTHIHTVTYKAQTQEYTQAWIQLISYKWLLYHLAGYSNTNWKDMKDHKLQIN